MSDCFIRTFDPLADPTYKLTKSDRLIMLRSGLTHSEFQFSDRYNGISASATMADKCRCFRFKMIDYSKHPKRWKTQVVHLTDAQEDKIMIESLMMAGIIKRLEVDAFPHLVHLGLHYWEGNFNKAEPGRIWQGKNALKYDLLGVSFSFILPGLRIWRPHHKWVFCSESCCILLQVVFKDFEGRADEKTPEILYDDWEAYNAA